MKSTIFNFSVFLLCLLLTNPQAIAAKNIWWFHKSVNWQAGRQALAWSGIVNSPDGKDHYRLAVVPLWAVEGGIVAIEILVARQDAPENNLLGQREMQVPQPFVVTVEELEKGIQNSLFGTKRVFHIGQANLQVVIHSSQLGFGVGDCGNCRNIQALKVEFSFGNN